MLLPSSSIHSTSPLSRTEAAYVHCYVSIESDESESEGSGNTMSFRDNDTFIFRMVGTEWKIILYHEAMSRDASIEVRQLNQSQGGKCICRVEHIFELTQALELYRAYQGKIAECDREIEAQLERFEDRSTGEPPEAKPGRKRIKGNAPRFDVWTHLYRMTGVDLTRIDGVDAYTALKVISEIGIYPSVSD